VALAYVLHQPARVQAVFGTRSVRHLDEAMQAGDLTLSSDELEWLENGAVPFT
jgi:aryl-alcohol dehydrogenase-like predicted oxidoreductase